MFNSFRVWWLWLIGWDVVHHDVEVVLEYEPPLRATVERLQASYSFSRPPPTVQLPHRAVSRMLLRDAAFELRVRGDGVDAWYRFGRREPERLDAGWRRSTTACVAGRGRAHGLVWVLPGGPRGLARCSVSGLVRHLHAGGRHAVELGVRRRLLGSVACFLRGRSISLLPVEQGDAPTRAGWSCWRLLGPRRPNWRDALRERGIRPA